MRVEKKMNKQRKVLITITYNEMGIIIDTKAEEVAQPNLQPTCNNLATDAISRQAVRFIESDSDAYPQEWNDDYEKGFTDALNKVLALPSAQMEVIRCKDCEDYQTDWETSYPNRHYCATMDAMMPEDGFCSSAERREE